MSLLIIAATVICHCPCHLPLPLFTCHCHVIGYRPYHLPPSLSLATVPWHLLLSLSLVAVTCYCHLLLSLATVTSHCHMTCCCNCHLLLSFATVTVACHCHGHLPQSLLLITALVASLAFASVNAPVTPLLGVIIATSVTSHCPLSLVRSDVCDLCLLILSLPLATVAVICHRSCDLPLLPSLATVARHRFCRWLPHTTFVTCRSRSPLRLSLILAASFTRRFSCHVAIVPVTCHCSSHLSLYSSLATTPAINYRTH